MAVVWGVYARRPPCRREAAAEQLRAVYQAASIDAEPQAVADLLVGHPAADIIHFAVHGNYDPDGPGDGIQLVSARPSTHSRSWAPT